ncbi:hypothetical protein JCGZ_04559 [Jatropha curcas]|uniref:Uncharacterized protein n=1 Tax=Jatropha curcas TaxID=180498 RepID=A0A067LP17_JATCU|nr:hypothetical protein JCGZ_04559 [Jatropha curcas]
MFVWRRGVDRDHPRHLKSTELARFARKLKSGAVSTNKLDPRRWGSIRVRGGRKRDLQCQASQPPPRSR